MNKTHSIAFIVAPMIVFVSGCAPAKVPDAETAIKVAVAVWEPIYGKKEIAGEKPYKASLDAHGVWIVEGSLPKGMHGGVAVAEIEKDNGKILRISHGK